jgi:hypothetical protein
MTMPTPPPDTRAPGQTGHIADHNTISDALAALESAVEALEGAGPATDTGADAPVIESIGSVSGTATQLADTSRDYMVYLEVTTAGTATSLAMGLTSAASAVTLAASSTATLGQVYSFRLPAGWYFKWSGAGTAMANQNAVGC